MPLLPIATRLLLPALFIGLLALPFCSSPSDGRPDVSHIPVQVSIQRFDRDLFAIDTTQIAASVATLQAKYPILLPIFTTEIIHDRSNPDETPEQAIRHFVTVPEIRQLYDTVQQVYGDLHDIEKQLVPMFQYYRYYFPQKPQPRVAAIISEFATDAFTCGDSLCGIGLDMFLGENYPGYDPETYPAYIRRQFRREYIPIRLTRALAQNLADTPNGERLLDWMLYNGKVLYAAKHLLPDTPDSLLMGYTRAQIEGCQANEATLWAKLLDAKLLYSTDFNLYRKLVTPSPNAPVAFAETPGEAGNWLGWQIVNAYMQHNPNTTLPQLLQASDAQQFLEKAHYKPRRIE